MINNINVELGDSSVVMDKNIFAGAPSATAVTIKFSEDTLNTMDGGENMVAGVLEIRGVNG